MAKYVCENPPPPGNYGILQVYISKGITCVRVPDTLDGKRVKTAPEFANTRKHASLFAQAAPLAAVVHRTLPMNKQRAHYQLLAGKAYQWLKAGNTPEEVHLLLLEAAELIRKALNRERVKAFLAERKKGSKQVFVIPEAGRIGENVLPHILLSPEGSRMHIRSHIRKKYYARCCHLV